VSEHDQDPDDQAFEVSYNQLGQFIRRQNPYGRVTTLPSLPVELEFSDGLIKMAGWLRDNNVGTPKSSSDDEMTVAEKQQCLHWDYPTSNQEWELKNYRVTKALLIPYRYNREDNGEEMCAYFLVGYIGAGDPIARCPFTF
jgi:hypothetical protein